MKKILLIGILLLGLAGCSKEKELKPEDYDKGGFVVEAISEVIVMLYSTNDIGRDHIAMERTVLPGEIAFSVHPTQYKLVVQCIGKGGCGYKVNGNYFDQSKTFLRGSI